MGTLASKKVLCPAPLHLFQLIQKLFQLFIAQVAFYLFVVNGQQYDFLIFCKHIGDNSCATAFALTLAFDG